MSFVFPETHTERVDYFEVFKGVHDLSADYLREATAARNAVCDSLISQPSSLQLLSTLEKYLPFIYHLVNISEKSEKFQKVPKFRWRSVLSKGIRMNLRGDAVEKPFIECKSLYFEAIYTLLAYGFALCNIANKRLGSNAYISAEQCLNDAADLLAKASGVFRYICQSFAPRWINPPKERPPECSPEILHCLSEVAIVDANRIAAIKAEKKSLSLTTWLKINVFVLNGYGQVRNQLKLISSRDADELADPFKEYIEDGYRITEALLLKKLAEAKHDEGENGIAVSCISQSLDMFRLCSHSSNSAYRKIASDSISVAEDLKSKYVRINNNVTYQRVVDLGEILASLPSAASVKNAIAFSMPDSQVLSPKHSET